MKTKIKTEAEIERFLVERIADIVQLPAHAIDPEAPHADHGLDSASAVLLTADLEDELGIELSPALAWDHPNLKSIVRHLATKIAERDEKKGAA